MTLQVGETLRFGWETFKKNPWTMVGAVALTFLISGILNGILSGVLPIEGERATYMSSAMNFFLSLTIGVLIEMGLLTFMLRAHDAIESVTFSALWNPQPFLNYLVAQVLVGLSVMVGLILLIVPGIIVALGLIFTPYIVLDTGKGPIEAMKESWSMTKGRRWKLLLLVCAIAGLNIVGALLFFVGLIVTVPVSMLAFTHAYRKLSQSVDVVPTA